jgi:hypothetical protein
VPYERCSIEEQSTQNIVDGRVVSSDVVRGDLRFYRMRRSSNFTFYDIEKNACRFTKQLYIDK